VYFVDTPTPKYADHYLVKLMGELPSACYDVELFKCELTDETQCAPYDVGDVKFNSLYRVEIWPFSMPDNEPEWRFKVKETSKLDSSDIGEVYFTVCFIDELSLLSLLTSLQGDLTSTYSIQADANPVAVNQ